MGGFTFVGWTAPYRECAYWRMELPFEQLRAQFGLSAQASPQPMVSELAGAGVIVGQRLMDKPATATWTLLAQHGKRMVFEVDDDLWHIDAENTAAPIYDAGRQMDLRRNIETAALVTVSTEPLAEVVREWNPNVAVLHNYLHEDVLETPRTRASVLTVGWSGSQSHLLDLRALGASVAQALTHRPARFHFVGTDYSEVLGVAASFTPYLPDPRGYLRNLDFDIGLAPLANTPFNRSKSHVRVLEYAALGIPTIASPVGETADFVEHGVTGFLATTPQEWREYLELLLDDADLRARIGAAAHEKAHDYTIQKHAEDWLLAYGKVL